MVHINILFFETVGWFQHDSYVNRSEFKFNPKCPICVQVLDYFVVFCKCTDIKSLAGTNKPPCPLPGLGFAARLMSPLAVPSRNPVWTRS